MHICIRLSIILVSIPYKRVTNGIEILDHIIVGDEFQSPISGSQTDGTAICIEAQSWFQSPISGSQTNFAQATTPDGFGFNPL